MSGSSKAALDGLMRNMAVELAPNVRVNSVLPGGMITEMTKEMFEDPELKEKFEKDYPFGYSEGFLQYFLPIIDRISTDIDHR